MPFRFVFAVVLLLLAPFRAEAANPSLALEFSFNPAFNLGQAPPQPFLMDACNDALCASMIGTMSLNCSMQKVAVGNTVAITRCTIQASLNRFNPDPNLTLLGRPSYLRLRYGGLVSAPFYFAGGQPALPPTVYRYLITPAVSGFAVSLRPY